MNFVIDMNLSTGWVQFLQGLGHDAVHWSSIGQQDADDEDILSWASAQDRIILTNDLDFGMLLIVSGALKPSVVQLRTDQTLPKHGGALVTVEPGRLRLRSLDIDPEE